MWLDDDGDDDPIAGPVPDPASRHWRHPSEIAAELAAQKARDAEQAQAARTPALIGGSPESSMLWPIAVVGGSIAVAAFGVLYLLGTPTRSEISANGASLEPIGAIVGAEPTNDSTVSTSTMLLNPLSNEFGEIAGDEPSTSGDSDDQPDGPNGPSADDGGAFGDALNTEHGDGEQETYRNSVLENSDLENSDLQNSDLEDQEIADKKIEDTGPENGADISAVDSGDRAVDGGDTAVAGSDTSAEDTVGDQATTENTMPAARLALLPAGPAIYDRPEPTGTRLAAVVPVGRYLLTSASALAGRTEVALLVGNRWIDATVVDVDMFSDVAVVTADDEAAAASLPQIAVATEPIEVKAEAFAGYCQPVDGDAGTSLSGSDTALDDRPGCGDGQPRLRSYAASATDDESQPPAVPRLPTTTTTTASGSKTGAKNLEARRGVVFSDEMETTTRSDHTIYDPITAAIRSADAEPGGPLRDEAGRIVGLILASSDYYVSALPIDRAIAVADSLMVWGVGSPAWLGIEGRRINDRFEVEAVNESSPAFGTIEVGDRLLSVDGQQILSQDHLIHVVRQAGLGSTIDIVLRRNGKILMFAEIELAG